MWNTNGWKVAALLGFCLCLAACGGRPQYEYADNKDVLVENINSRVLEGGFMEVSAELRNNNRNDVNTTRYQMQWFDQNGFLLEKSSWRPVRVTRGAPEYVRVRSTKPGVKDFTLVISSEAQ